jgi:hypothetical protein
MSLLNPTNDDTYKVFFTVPTESLVSIKKTLASFGAGIHKDRTHEQVISTSNVTKHITPMHPVSKGGTDDEFHGDHPNLKKMERVKVEVTCVGEMMVTETLDALKE